MDHETKIAYGRIADTLLKLHYAQKETTKRVEDTYGQVLNIGTQLAVLRSELEHAADDVDKLREDISQPIALASKKDLSIEQHVEAAKTWFTVVAPIAWRVAVGIAMASGWAYHLLTASHGR